MRSIVALPNDYVVVDLETTGRNSKQDSITEIAAIKYRNGQEVAQYHQMVKPEKPISGFVIMLTHITPYMVEDAPTIDNVIGDFAEFIGSDILIGHNIAGFDSLFIEKAYEKHLGRSLENECVDTMRLAKKVCPKLPEYSLEFLSEHLGIARKNAHRALADCLTTNACYCKMRDIVSQNGSPESFCANFSRQASAANAQNFTPKNDNIRTDHPLYGKNIVFTGAIVLTRSEAMQLSVDFGAIPQNGVTTKTDYLVVGTQDLDRVGTDGLSSKEEKAIRFNKEGKAKIKIITEAQFIEMTKV